MRKLSIKYGFSLIEVLLYLSCSIGLITLVMHNYTNIEAHFQKLNQHLASSDQKRFLALYLTKRLALLPTLLPKILLEHSPYNTKITQKLGHITTLRGYDHATELPLNNFPKLSGPILELRDYNLANLKEVTYTYLAIAYSETTKQYGLYQIRPKHPKTEIAAGVSAWQITYGVINSKKDLSYFSASEITAKNLWKSVSLLKIMLFLNVDSQTAAITLLIPINQPLL